MDLTLQYQAETRKQSLQSWVPIDFSGITCISKGFQDTTWCPISSKTKRTWILVPLSSEGCSLPSCYIFILWFYSCVFILHIFLFSGQQSPIVMWRVPILLPSPVVFLLLSSNVILSSDLIPALTALSCFGSVFYSENKTKQKNTYGLGTLPHCIF